MDKRTSEQVVMTDLISPSLFFYYSIDDYKTFCLVKNSEESLKTYLDGVTPEKCSIPGKDEICGFYHGPSKKWIKVRFITPILKKNGVDTVLLWCIDYGTSLCTDNLRSIVKIPEGFQIDHNFIKSGSLNISPVLKPDASSAEWSSKVTRLTKSLLELSISSLTLKTTEKVHRIPVGDLLVDHGGTKFSVNTTLIEQKRAIAGHGHLEFKEKSALNWSAYINMKLTKVDTDDVTFVLPEIDEPKKKTCNFSEIFQRLERDSLANLAIKNALDQLRASELASRFEVFESTETESKEMPSVPSLEPQKFGKLSDAENALGFCSKWQNSIFSTSTTKPVFVHGKYLPNPVETIETAGFTKEIHGGLHALNFRAVYRTQSFGWPLIQEGRSVFVINGPRSGKTFSYLPAILTSIAFEGEGGIRAAQGPTAVIVTRSSRQVDEIYNYCSKMIPRGKLEIVKASGLWNLHDIKICLLNGCDLLITTPPCFSRLAEGEAIRMINKTRVKHLIFDELDAMHDIFEKEIAVIVRACTNGDKAPETNPQIVATSTSWMPWIRKYMKLSCDPVVIIGSFIEAALYSSCELKILKVMLEQKLVELLNLLETGEWKQRRTVVVINSDKEADLLEMAFSKHQISHYKISTITDRENAARVASGWDNAETDLFVLMITDEMWPSLTIRNAEVLLHFSLPDNWKKFSQRLVMMSGNILRKAEGKSNVRLDSIVLLDDDNANEVPKLVEFLKDRKVLKDIPAPVKEMVKEIVRNREIMKHSRGDAITPMCVNILEFGECSNVSCKGRHAFTQMHDTPPANMPVDGLVKFVMFGIRSPSQYAIQVREYLPMDDYDWISCKDTITETRKSLNGMQVILNHKNSIQIPILAGDMCAYFSPLKVKWVRCRVVEKELSENSCRVKVHLIDYGSAEIVESKDLKVLPDHMKTMEPLVVDLRILSLVPFDKDDSWDHETTGQVEKHLRTMENKDYEFICRVKFSIRGTIFANTFEIREYSEELETSLTVYELRKDLLKKNFCLMDETVELKLKEHLNQSKLYVPDTETSPFERCLNEHKAAMYQSKEQEEEVQAAPRLKHLTVGADYNVHIKQVRSPDHFYVKRIETSNNTLKRLMNEIERCDLREPIGNLKEGKFCMFAGYDGTMQRGVIEKVKESGEIEVFLLDYGIALSFEKHEIYKIPSRLIEMAPFQAIQCRLFGVKPKFNTKEWAPRLSTCFKELINETCGENLITMRVISCEKKVYKVMLFHPESGERLDKLIIAEGIAYLSDDTTDLSLVSYDHSPMKSTAEEESELDKIMKMLEEGEITSLITEFSNQLPMNMKP